MGLRLTYRGRITGPTLTSSVSARRAAGPVAWPTPVEVAATPSPRNAQRATPFGALRSPTSGGGVQGNRRYNGTRLTN